MVAATWPDPMWVARSKGALGGSTQVAAWRGDRKQVWTDGEVLGVDLGSNRTSGEPTEPWPELREMVEAVLAR